MYSCSNVMTVVAVGTFFLLENRTERCGARPHTNPLHKHTGRHICALRRRIYTRFARTRIRIPARADSCCVLCLLSFCNSNRNYRDRNSCCFLSPPSSSLVPTSGGLSLSLCLCLSVSLSLSLCLSPCGTLCFIPFWRILFIKSRSGNSTIRPDFFQQEQEQQQQQQQEI